MSHEKFGGSYTTQFLSLKCAGDVLNIAAPIQRAEKEISESMAIIPHLRKIAIKEPMKYTLVDLCAGNALTSLIAIHLLPFKLAIAVDKRERSRKFDQAQRFFYLHADIMDNEATKRLLDEADNIIITATHACSGLAHRIVELYTSSPQCKALVLMPCCCGEKKNKIPQGIQERVGKYLSWAYDLSLSARGTFLVDKKCLSPCNAVVLAQKEK